MKRSKKYDIIYADPPWKPDNKNTGGSLKSGSSSKYKTMTAKEIGDIPIQKICNNDCVLFMWWIGSMPIEALYVVSAWGFTIKTMTGFTWIKKTKRKFLDWFGMGFWTRQQAENTLIAIKGKPKRINKSVRQLIYAINEGHSIKPDETRERIINLMGNLPRIELFARKKVKGWDAWGDEINSDVKL